jgi:hypothetical protein
MKRGAAISEQQLAARVVAWLEDQHWDVYQEVPWGGVIDIVAVRAGLVWSIECKTSLSLRVMAQAEGHHTHLRSVAVPAIQNGVDRALAARICRDYLQIGVLELVPPQFGELGVRECPPPPLMRCYHSESLKLRAALKPEHKTYAPAGTSGGSYYSPYKDTMRRIQRFLAGRGQLGATLAEIIEAEGQAHYRTLASAKSCIPTALEHWEKDWCEIRGNGKGRRYYMRQAQAMEKRS